MCVCSPVETTPCLCPCLQCVYLQLSVIFLSSCAIIKQAIWRVSQLTLHFPPTMKIDIYCSCVSVSDSPVWLVFTAVLSLVNFFPVIYMPFSCILYTYIIWSPHCPNVLISCTTLHSCAATYLCVHSPIRTSTRTHIHLFIFLRIHVACMYSVYTCMLLHVWYNMSCLLSCHVDVLIWH